VGVLSAQTQADDVAGGIGELLGQIAVASPVQHDVQRQGADQLEKKKRRKEKEMKKSK